MSDQAITVLAIGASEATCQALSGAGMQVTAGAHPGVVDEHDALLLCLADGSEMANWAGRDDLPQVAFDTAVVVHAPEPHDAHETALLRLGVEAIVTDAAALPRGIQHAVLRKQVERLARNAYATDLATGLPHQAQLLEHMTQLLALREREPAPMVLLVLRIEGFTQAAARLGGEAGNILRRKVAVRLRAGLRASDVVASVGPDAFGVLLGHVEALGDGERVATKLARALQSPLVVAGQPCRVAATVGLALYPDHGKDAQALLKRASAQAGSVATLGRQGAAEAARRGPAGAAANDDT
jgi:diguanylate cyclase (GGDEF)-like protein